VWLGLLPGQVRSTSCLNSSLGIKLALCTQGAQSNSCPSLLAPLPPHGPWSIPSTLVSVSKSAVDVRGSPSGSRPCGAVPGSAFREIRRLISICRASKTASPEPRIRTREARRTAHPFPSLSSSANARSHRSFPRLPFYDLIRVPRQFVHQLLQFESNDLIAPCWSP